MNEISLLDLARLGLATVFLLAGTKAFANGGAYREMLIQFGVPNIAVRPLATALPLFELAIGVFLLAPSLASGAALAGLFILCCYTAVISYALLIGKRPSCNCFGQLSNKPISSLTLARNACFILLASMIVWQMNLPETSRAALRLNLIQGIIISALLLQSWIIMHLLRQQGRLLLSIDNIELQLRAAGIEEISPSSSLQGQRGLELGTLAPDFDAILISEGAKHTFSQVRARNRPTILIFSDSACGPCKDLMPRIAEWRSQYAKSLSFMIVTTAHQQGTVSVDNILSRVTYIQNGREASALYQASATPSCVVVSSEGAVASTLAVGATQIEKLVTAMAAAHEGVEEPEQLAQWQSA